MKAVGSSETPVTIHQNTHRRNHNLNTKVKLKVKISLCVTN
jgi:hypothetical protein